MLKSIYLLILFVPMCNCAAAQDRIAGVNTDKLMERIPEIAKAAKGASQFQDSLNHQLQKLEEEIKVCEKFIAADTNCHFNFSANTTRDKVYKDFREKAVIYWNLMQVNDRLLPLKAAAIKSQTTGKLKDLLKKIAIENGYCYIIDLCEASKLPLPPCYDITDLVIVKLGL